jgi:hypothetical protein
VQSNLIAQCWENPLIALRSAHTVLPVCQVKQLKCLCKIFIKLAAKFHTRARCSSSSFIVTLSLIRRTACARAQFSGCSSTTNAYSETGQMAVCCQNLTLGALSSRSALSMLVGALFKRLGLFFNTPHIVKRAAPAFPHVGGSDNWFRKWNPGKTASRWSSKLAMADFRLQSRKRKISPWTYV